MGKGWLTGYTIMAREDWISVKIPVLMADAIDRWLALDVAKKNGVFSRPDFLISLIREYFRHFEKDFGIFVPREMRRNLKGFDVTKPFD